MLPEVVEDHVMRFLPLPPALQLAQVARTWRAACSRARFDALEGISEAAQARWSTQTFRKILARFGPGLRVIDIAHATRLRQVELQLSSMQPRLERIRLPSALKAAGMKALLSRRALAELRIADASELSLANVAGVSHGLRALELQRAHKARGARHALSLLVRILLSRRNIQVRTTQLVHLLLISSLELNLEELRVSGAPLVEGALLTRTRTRFGALRSLELSHCGGVSFGQLADLVTHAPRLAELDLSGATLALSGAAALARVLPAERSCASRLRDLRLDSARGARDAEHFGACARERRGSARSLAFARALPRRKLSPSPRSSQARSAGCSSGPRSRRSRCAAARASPTPASPASSQAASRRRRNPCRGRARCSRST